MQDELVNVSGGLEFLQAVGFQLVFDEADGYSPLAPVVQCSASPQPAWTCLASRQLCTGVLQGWMYLSALTSTRRGLCRYAVLPEDEPLEQLHAALRALDHTFQPQQPQPKVASPPIRWSEGAAVASDASAGSQAAPAPVHKQRTQDAQPALRSASGAAAEPRDRQTQVRLNPIHSTAPLTSTPAAERQFGRH